MNIYDGFDKQRRSWGVDAGFGQGGSGFGISTTSTGKPRRPQTMAEWKTFVEGLSRYERDKLYPGMHIDLIPAYEMITGGDPTWGSEVASESPAQLGLAGQGNNRLLRSPSGVGANTGLLHASPALDLMGNSPAAAGPLYPGTPGRGQQQPDTMAGWKDLVDGMTRHERDKLWPGMHKDLIPATEMIEAGAGGIFNTSSQPTTSWTSKPPAGTSAAGGSGAKAYASHSPKVVDNAAEATEHYFFGNGESVELGPETQEAIMNHKDQKWRQERITSGQTPDIWSGNYSVDMTFTSKWWVGETPVHYATTCTAGECTTTFTSKGDGIWDSPPWATDRQGPEGELPGGTGYAFLPFSWQVTFPRP